jgi:hypothetical protein
MIGHYHYCMEAKFSAVPRKTCVDDDLTHRLRKSPAIMHGECYEKDFEIGLIVGQFAAVFIFAQHTKINARSTTGD